LDRQQKRSELSGGLEEGTRMQFVTDTQESPSVAGANAVEVSVECQSPYPEHRIIRRNGAVSARVRELAAGLTAGAVSASCATSRCAAISALTSSISSSWKIRHSGFPLRTIRPRGLEK
jgi:hypothetical protein